MPLQNVKKCLSTCNCKRSKVSSLASQKRRAPLVNLSTKAFDYIIYKMK